MLEEFPQKLDEYEKMTEEGNYLNAREIVLLLNEEAEKYYQLISEIPSLLTEIQTKIPASIHELRTGHREMEEQSYYLHHLELTKNLDRIEQELKKLEEELANLNITYVSTRIQEINDEIDNFYDLLEKEVDAKKYVDKNCDST